MSGNKPVRLYMEGDTVVLEVRVYLDIRTEDVPLAREMALAGLRRAGDMSPYQCGGRDISIRVDVEETDGFSLDAVNLRVYDITPVVRWRLSPKYNVSHAFLGAARPGLGKLIRRAAGVPDISINLGGRDIHTERGMTLMQTVVMHEFMHVISFMDKYRGKKGKKLRRSVQDRDIMYRTGGSQRLMEYHVKRLADCAKKGKLPIRWV